MHPEKHPDEITYLPPSTLSPSPLHRRRYWGDMRALGVSIKENGMLQPIVARLVVAADGESYEVVIGERRRRASLAAGIEFAPVIVRVYTDEEAIDAQIKENLEREDIHPMDEAELYEMLVDRGHTTAEIAARHAKDVPHVAQRLVLCKLAKPVREAYLKDRIGHHAAFEVACIPDHAAQLRALEIITADEYLSHGDIGAVASTLRRRVLFRLADAPFDRADPSLTDAGACGPCPSRSGAQPNLFPSEDPGEDYCLRPECHALKVTATFKRAAELAEQDGFEVLEKSARLFTGHSPAHPTLTPEAQKLYRVAADVADHTPRKPLTYDAAVKRSKIGAKPVLAQGTDGRPVLLYPLADAQKALRVLRKEKEPEAVKPSKPEKPRPVSDSAVSVRSSMARDVLRLVGKRFAKGIPSFALIAHEIVSAAGKEDVCEALGIDEAALTAIIWGDDKPCRELIGQALVLLHTAEFVADRSARNFGALCKVSGIDMKELEAAHKLLIEGKAKKR